MTLTLTNIHPADELFALRADIKQLEKRADSLRDQLLSGDIDLKGAQVEAVILPQTRETLDKAALIEAYGEDAIKPFIKRTTYSLVKLKEVSE